MNDLLAEVKTEGFGRKGVVENPLADIELGERDSRGHRRNPSGASAASRLLRLTLTAWGDSGAERCFGSAHRRVHAG
jgi:hypothetical protein